MKNSVGSLQLRGFVFSGALGTLLHFFFDWSGENVFAGLVSAVNESIWEHMKLLFYPMVLFAWWEHRRIGVEYPRFWCVKAVGITLGLVLIPTLYYTYTGALGVSADWFNITIFFVAAGVVYRAETALLEGVWCGGCNEKAAVAWLLMIAAAFTVLTFVQPRIPLFQDPVTGTYGIWGSG